ERNYSVMLLQTIQRQQKLLKAYTEHLENVTEGLDKFAYIVSHDLKAPLRAIGNLAEWVREGIEEARYDEIPEQIGLLKRRIGRMENLIEGILDYSRAGREYAQQGRVDVRQMLKEIFDAQHPDAALTIHWPDELPTFRTAHTALSQVFANLISNAVKYGATENPEVTIGFEDQAESPFYIFSVRDNGPGIDPKNHGRIFEIFTTLHSRDRYESSGVGLTIVKKIVTDMGGEISLESAPSAGACFTFTWPRVLNTGTA
ncbi:MAG: ATP-binding protein, partial [Bacteroidota bacterium]